MDMKLSTNEESWELMKKVDDIRSRGGGYDKIESYGSSF